LCHSEVGVSGYDEYVPVISASTSLQPVSDEHTVLSPDYLSWFTAACQ